MKKIFKILKHRILNILFWSIVSAAFIGPGTVTTATKSGFSYQFDLMWAMVFSVFACLLLQEASARITILSGMNLGEAISKHFENKKSKNFVLILIIGSIIIGSAAYEAGNILGSVEGIHFVFKSVPKFYFVIAIGIFAALALSLRSMRAIARFLGAIVFLMGFAFIATAIFLKPDISAVIKGCFVPTIPDTSGAGLLILGIIGTTVVPYDLFLGSSIVDKSQTIKDARIGLAVAIILGGIISLSIITVGASITNDMTPEAVNNFEFSYDRIKEVFYLNTFIGDKAVYIFGFGMFAAGLTSAITAPLASGITANSIFKSRKSGTRKSKMLLYKVISYGILIVGLIFGFLEVKPIPAIILAQAFNGIILPFISIFLLFVINNPKLVGKEMINSNFSNILMGIVVWVTMLIGTVNVIKAISKVFHLVLPPDTLFIVVAIICLIITIYIMYKVFKLRKTN